MHFFALSTRFLTLSSLVSGPGGGVQAIVAWSEVEEVNAAAIPDMSSMDEECDITTDACQDYQRKMAELEQVRGGIS